MLVLVVGAVVSAVYFRGYSEQNILPVSVLKEQYTPPIIVLDAGHGESS